MTAVLSFAPCPSVPHPVSLLDHLVHRSPLHFAANIGWGFQEVYHRHQDLGSRSTSILLRGAFPCTLTLGLSLVVSLGGNGQPNSNTKETAFELQLLTFINGQSTVFDDSCRSFSNCEKLWSSVRFRLSR